MNTQEENAVRQWFAKGNSKAFQHSLNRNKSIDWNKTIALSNKEWVSKNVRAALLPQMKSTIELSYYQSPTYSELLSWFNDKGNISRAICRIEEHDDEEFKAVAQEWCHRIFNDRNGQWMNSRALTIDAMNIAMEFDYHIRYTDSINVYQKIIPKMAYYPIDRQNGFFHKIPLCCLSENMFDYLGDNYREGIEFALWIRQGSTIKNAQNLQKKWIESWTSKLGQPWAVDSTHGEFRTTLWFKDAAPNQLRKIALAALWIVDNEHPALSKEHRQYINDTWLPELYHYTNVRSEIEMHRQLQTSKAIDLESFWDITERQTIAVNLPFHLETP